MTAREEYIHRFNILVQHYPDMQSIRPPNDAPLEEMKAVYERCLESIQRGADRDELKVKYIILLIFLELIYVKVLKDNSKTGLTIRELAIPMETEEDIYQRIRQKMAALRRDYDAFIRHANIVGSLLESYENGTDINVMLLDLLFMNL